MKFNYPYTKWMLIALTTIAAVLRYFTLDTISLDFEEQLIWFCGMQNSPFEALLLIAKLKPFSLILTITAWLSCWDGVYFEMLNRCISITAGVIAVPLIFILTRKFYSEIEGIIAAGFIAFSWSCIAASQNMAEFSILLVFILLYFIALITFLDRISEERFVSKQENIFLIITGILLAFSSIWGILIILISFFYSFFFIKKINIFLKTLARFAYMIIPIGLFTWWGLTLNIVYTANKYTAIEYLNSINYIISNNYFLSIILIIPIFYLIFIYIKRLFSKDEFGEDAKTKFNNSTLVISIWLAASVVGFILITFLLRINFHTSDLIFILPPLFILIARSIILISNKLKNQIIISSIFGFLFLISIFINLENINNKPEYNQAVRYIMRDKNEFGILIPAHNNFPKEAFTYYLQKNRIKNKIFLMDDFDIITKKIDEDLDYFWLIFDNIHTDKKIISDLHKKNLIRAGYRYKGITIYKIGGD